MWGSDRVGRLCFEGVDKIANITVLVIWNNFGIQIELCSENSNPEKSICGASEKKSGPWGVGMLMLGREVTLSLSRNRSLYTDIGGNRNISREKPFLCHLPLNQGKRTRFVQKECRRSSEEQGNHVLTTLSAVRQKKETNRDYDNLTLTGKEERRGARVKCRGSPPAVSEIGGDGERLRIGERRGDGDRGSGGEGEAWGRAGVERSGHTVLKKI